LECDGGGNIEPQPIAVLSTSFEDTSIETMKHMLDNIHSIEAAMPLSGPASQLMLGHYNLLFSNQ